MSRVSKAPEVRKQELIGIALDLFKERGYENVSVRDILKKVNGHPGMFYYYFESKQEIYNEAMKQMIKSEVDKRKIILQDESKSIINKYEGLLKSIEDGIRSYYIAFNNPENISYETTVLLCFLTAFAEPVSKFLLDAKNEGLIPEESGLNEDTAYPMALFLIHGCYGLVHVNNDSGSADNVKYFEPFICNFLKINIENLKQKI
ncbi:TetR/AcrR family transcriptional regulator [Anaerosphaera multitolerans]|uniref:TetR/AcrR family transcriptional regulator n=1 Tax=Anaerosphaera multitolerans TaxID=2487351 RepID=UPI001F0BC09C|nr:TetR/AcrR family transcriptional regulator [Anaerosphaera multitolerans]